MKLALTIHSAKARVGPTSPDHGLYVAWAELDGVEVTGVLARGTDRDSVEQRARLELAHRMSRLLGSPGRTQSGPRRDGQERLTSV